MYTMREISDAKSKVSTNAPTRRKPDRYSMLCSNREWLSSRRKKDEDRNERTARTDQTTLIVAIESSVTYAHCCDTDEENHRFEKGLRRSGKCVACGVSLYSTARPYAARTARIQYTRPIRVCAALLVCALYSDQALCDQELG
jgi:hypothetical protein